jgi:hypothetical protein
LDSHDWLRGADSITGQPWVLLSSSVAIQAVGLDQLTCSK